MVKVLFYRGFVRFCGEICWQIVVNWWWFAWWMWWFGGHYFGAEKCATVLTFILSRPSVRLSTSVL
jgi:hypothetical protein